VSWVVVQFDMQPVVAVGFVIGVRFWPVPIGTESAVPGIKQPVWQLAAVALQPIMQAVVAEEIADDTDGGGATVGSACAEAPSTATAPIAVATRSVTQLRISASEFAQAER
jgi:hypothetical protein